MTFWSIIRGVLAAGSVMIAEGPAAASETPAGCISVHSAAIQKLTDDWQAAIASGDVNAIADFYTADAVLLPSAAGAPHMGTVAIRAYFTDFVGRHPKAVMSMRSVVTGCGMATEMGTATFRVTGIRKGTRMYVGGSYATVFTERNGRWLIAQQSLSLIPEVNRRMLLGR